MPHPLRHGPTVYNGHLRGPVTLSPVAERLAVELSLPVFLRLRFVATEDRTLRHRGGTPFEEMDLLVKFLGPESSQFAASIRAANTAYPDRGLGRLLKRLYERY